jgi:uncharacterized membrane protein
VSFLQRQLEDPERFVRIKWGFYLFLALIVLAEVVLPLIFHGGHHYFGFEGWPAFGSLYGLISCVLIIVVSKAIGKLLLMRKEDHYDS